jgi:hypothetical protein
MARKRRYPQQPVVRYELRRLDNPSDPENSEWTLFDLDGESEGYRTIDEARAAVAEMIEDEAVDPEELESMVIAQVSVVYHPIDI